MRVVLKIVVEHVLGNDEMAELGEMGGIELVRKKLAENFESIREGYARDIGVEPNEIVHMSMNAVDEKEGK